MSLRASLFIAVAFALVISAAIAASTPSEQLLHYKHLVSTGRQKDAVDEFKQHLQDNGSNFKCTICVVVFTIVRNEIGDKRKDIEDFMGKVCNYLPPRYNSTCHFMMTVFGEQVIQALLRKDNPSKICNDLKTFNCNGCTLNNYNAITSAEEEANALRQDFFANLLAIYLSNAKEREPGARFGLNKKFGDHVIPVVDNDKDFFSPTHASWRGADWRGADCDDNNANVRPGLLVEPNPQVDSNCNGIFGVDEAGNSLEKLYCANTTTRTVLMFGDSASSLFHIPPEWLHLQNISNLLYTIDDEFDWPEYSWSTGFDERINGESINMKLRSNNLCNHRDFQNLGHNGGKMKDLSGYQFNGLTVNKDVSKPFLGFIAYIGNDVCKSDLKYMTKPAEFEASLLKGLAQLDAVAPPNSKFLIMGLVDGRILWNEMAHRQHPLGCTYEQMYRFLMCTDANPCETWLTPNETMRDATSFRAAELSEVANKVVQQSVGKYKNLELDYIRFPLQEAIDECKKLGISPHLLIEAFDGFHPSYLGHRFFAKHIWQHLVTKHPEWIGPVNPNNDAIFNRFGNQGGF